MRDSLAYASLKPDLRTLALGCSGPGAGNVGFYDRHRRSFSTEGMDGFVGDVFATGRALIDQGVKPQQIVLVYVSDNRDLLRAFLGAIAIGAVPLIMPVRPAFDDPTSKGKRLDSVLGAIPSNPVVIAASKSAGPTADLPFRHVSLPQDLRPFDRSPIVLPTPEPRDVAYLQLSSGSTGSPRAIAITHAAVIAQIASLAERCRLEDDETALTWLPLYHDLALVAFAFTPMALRGSMYFMTPFDFLGDPATWFRSLSETRATTTTAPNFGLRHAVERCDEAHLVGVDLSGLRRLCCGAEPISPAILRSFTERFAAHGLRDDIIVPSYGMAEATLMLSMAARGRPVVTATVPRADITGLGALSSIQRKPLSAEPPDTRNRIELVGLGAAGMGTEIWIADPAGTRVDSDLVCGEVVVRSSSLAAGYLRPDGTVEPFATEAFFTGDVGFLDGDELYIVDRLKSTIIRGGQSISAAAIEDLVAEVTGLPTDAVVVIDSDLADGAGRITALIELSRGAKANKIIAAMRRSSARFRPAVDDLVLVRVNGLPRTTSGKKRHRDARHMYRTGQLRVIDRMALTPGVPETAKTESFNRDVLDLIEVETRSLTHRAVEEMVHRRHPDIVVTDAAALTSDLGLDSLQMYELAVTLEDRLEIAIFESDLSDFTTVGEIVSLCTDRRRQPSAAGSGITAAIEAASKPFPQLLRVADDQKGRQVCIDGRWVTDFASCNYLGLDLHPYVINAIEPAVRHWGVHPSWTRAVASPAPYRELEARLAALVGVDDTVVFPALTLLHLSALPVLATPTGTLFIDRFAHQSLHQAGELASARGSTVATFDHHDLDCLDHRLHKSATGPRIIVVDGVYSMSGATAPLIELVALAERHDATIYVDDAHGFGLLGENPTEAEPFGHRGNGVVNHLGLTHERIVYCAGLSKAYSSMGAFVAARTPAERRQFEEAATLVFSGPIPTASLASAIAGLDVNDAHGDDIRRHLFALTDRLIDGTRRLGLHGHNGNRFPIVNLTIGSVDQARLAAEILWEHGLLVTPSVFPAVPLDASGVRFTVTAANTDDDVKQALDALAEVAADVTASVDQVSSSATMA